MKCAGMLLFLLACWPLAAAENEGFAGAVPMVAPASTPISRPRPERDARTGERLWRYSIASLAVANVLDMQSSWGKHETNQLLASPGGTFGTRGTAIKLSLHSGLIGAEYLLLRGRTNPGLRRILSYINFGASGVIGATAMHNYTVPKVHR